MFGDGTSSRWIAIVGLIVGLSTCAACLLLMVLLSSAYGGETIRLRNPFAFSPPQLISNGNNPDTVSNNTGNDNNTGGSAGGSTTDTSDSAPPTSGGGTSPGENVIVPSTGDAADFLPTLSGYTRTNASSVMGAVDFVLGADFAAQSAGGETFSAQSLSGIATTVLVSRLDEFIGCYQRTGAVTGQIYVRSDVNAVLNGNLPAMGAIVVANQDRLRDSLVSCVVSPNDPNTFSAQAANQPCGNFGSFSASGDTFTYVYAGSSAEFCNAVEAYYGAFGG